MTSRRWRLIGVGLAILLMGGACRKEEASQATTRPQGTKGIPGREVLTIDEAPVALTKIELIATATGNGVSVQLTTPTANPEKDNSLNFDLTLDGIDDPMNLAGAEWQFKTDDVQREETLNGLTLAGRRAVLEPLDVHIVFGRQADRATIEIEGQFRWFEPPDAEKAKKTVTVSGVLTAMYPK